MSDRQPSLTDRFGSAHAETVRPIDVVVAVGLAALSLAAFVGGAPTVGATGPATVALLLLESLPLIVRRRYPLEVFLVVVGATLVHIAVLPQGAQIQAGLGVLVAFYTVGERLDRRLSVRLAALAGTSSRSCSSVAADSRRRSRA